MTNNELAYLKIINSLTEELAGEMLNRDISPRDWHPDTVSALRRGENVLRGMKVAICDTIRFTLARADAAQVFYEVITVAQAEAVTGQSAESLLKQAEAGTLSACARQFSGLWLFDLGALIDNELLDPEWEEAGKAVYAASQADRKTKGK